MRVINLGSLNIDKVYNVPHFVQAGETILSGNLEVFCGGKGLNQSVALARAGAEVHHLGAVGDDGAGLTQILADAGVNCQCVHTLEGASGHAIIQLNPKGQNCIIVYGGTNAMVTSAHVDAALSNFGKGDLLLVQNETSAIPYAIEKAKSLGIQVAINPSPITPELLEYPLHLVDYFLLNEVEGMELSGVQSNDFEAILLGLQQRFPHAAIVLTVGKHGAYYAHGETRAHHGIYNVPVVDTTAAGDTFCGFFLASLAKGMAPAEALHNASVASSIAVSIKGASTSIPTWQAMLEAPFAQ